MKKLKPSQTAALNAMRDSDRGIIEKPTSTGKSVIIAMDIINDIKSGRNKNYGAYQINVPRILLTKQFMEDFYIDLKDAGLASDIRLVSECSGKDLVQTLFSRQGIGDITGTTSPQKLYDEFIKARNDHKYSIFFSTYDSADKLNQPEIHIRTQYNDECHWLVSTEFADRLEMKADRKYFLTSTPKYTSAVNGLGMDNKDKFGPIIYLQNFKEAVEAQETVSPLFHCVDAKYYITEEEEDKDISDYDTNDADIKAISQAFRDHRKKLNDLGKGLIPKLLTATRGTKHLRLIEKGLLNDPKLHGVNIYAISSDYGAFKNGEEIARKEFLKSINNDKGEFIVLHIDILTEGINCPEFTSIMVFAYRSARKFIQLLGRGGRLHPEDRKLIEDKGKIEITEFKKLHSYIIIPMYGDYNKDMVYSLKKIVIALRTQGYTDKEISDIFEFNGESNLEDELEGINKSKHNEKSKKEFLGEMISEIEEDDKKEVFGKELADAENSFDNLEVNV